MRERQVSFAGGELSPDLWGRTDIDRYPVGARTLLNYLVTPQGIITNRTGTQHLSTLSDVAIDLVDAVRIARVVGFIFNGTSVVLVFSNNFVAYHNGDGGITTVFSYLDVPNLRFSQIGEVVVIACPGKNPRELRRAEGGTLSLTEVSYAVPNVPAWVTGPPEVRESGTFPFAGDSSHPPRPWQWAVTRIMQRTDGSVYETKKQLIVNSWDGSTLTTLPDEIAVYPDWTVNITLIHGKDEDPPTANDDALLASRVYRGRDGRFGFVGETTAVEFTDDGADPDYANPPPSETNPFNVYRGTTLDHTEHPAVVTHFEGRRYYGATGEQPTRVLGSAIEEFSNFDVVPIPDDADSLEFSLVSDRQDVVKALVPDRKLIALTQSGVWQIGGSGQDEVITPSSIAARQIFKNGCGDIAPVIAGGTTFFVGRRNNTIFALVSDNGQLKIFDVTLLARHLFNGHTVVDMAYAEEPYLVLWVVRSDGALLSLTYVPDQQIAAWTRHEIASDGIVESVTTVPDDEEDAVYLVVHRFTDTNTVRTVERLAPRVVDDVREQVFLDRATTYNGKHTPVNDIPGFEGRLQVLDTFSTGGQIGDSVRVVFDTILHDTIEMVEGQIIQIDDVEGGLPIRLLLVDKTSTPFSPTQIFTCQVLTIDIPDWLWGEDVADWFICTTLLTELDHLEGEEVTAFLDGDVVSGLTVNGGSIDLSEIGPAAIVTVGIPYNADFESLAAINDRGKQKINKQIFLEIEHRGGVKVGPDLDTLTDVRVREVADSYGRLEPKRQEAPLLIADRWKTTGYVALRQSEPLPVTIFGITREFEHGG